MTEPASPFAPIALLIHSGNAWWRRSMRQALQAMLDASSNAASVTLLVSSREAEAAKCLADPRVALTVAIDEPGIRRTLSSLGRSLPVVWATEHEALSDVIARVSEAIASTLPQRQRGSSA